MHSSCGVRVGAIGRPDVVRRTRPLTRGSFLALLLSDRPTPIPTALLLWMREALARGVCVAGLGRGAIALAEHGLLEGKRCAVRWNLFDSCVENFPNVLISQRYFGIDGMLHTSAGEAASFDLMLEIIKNDFGPDLRDSINEYALQGKARNLTAPQTQALHMRLERMRSPLLPIIQLMERTIAEPLTMRAIVGISGLSRRQVERLFQQQLGVAPKRFYCQIRIERAQSLLLNSGMPILDVAVATGFASHSNFSKVFRDHFGCTPQTMRARAQKEGEFSHPSAIGRATGVVSRVRGPNSPTFHHLDATE